MGIYFIHPELTLGNDDDANSFFDTCVKEAGKYLYVTELLTLNAILGVEPEKSDLIVFFNRSDQDYDSLIISVLKRFVKIECLVCPISLTKEHRYPPSICEKSQSFDIYDHLSRRKLTIRNIETVALVLARRIVCRAQPTLSKEEMKIFISYRREDGEDLSARIYKDILKRAESDLFRDLIDVRVGENAQELIEANLRDSDILLFLDTPRAGESKWIKIELEIALSLNIPVLWIKFGDNIRTPLPVKPASKPHFPEDINNNLCELDEHMIDKVIHKAFRISRNNANIALTKYTTIRDIVESKGYIFDVIDNSKLLYRLEIPRNKAIYYERPLIHYIQLYGRKPSQQDKKNFISFIKSKCFCDDLNHQMFYDTALMLSPTNKPYKSFNLQSGVESFDKYIHYLEKINQENILLEKPKKGIILSGAFPDCEPEHQHYLIEALHEISQEIIKNNYILIFGAHPTFKPILFRKAKEYRPDNYINVLRMYVSEYFATKTLLKDDEIHAQIKATKSIENDRELSLLLMRKTMIYDDDAVAMICLGGKTALDEHKPGIDEELDIARQRGIPAFLVGSVGGRSAVLAKNYQDTNSFDKINNLGMEANIFLNNSVDYKLITKKIIEEITKRENKNI